MARQHRAIASAIGRQIRASRRQTRASAPAPTGRMRARIRQTRDVRRRTRASAPAPTPTGMRVRIRAIKDIGHALKAGWLWNEREGWIRSSSSGKRRKKAACCNERVCLTYLSVRSRRTTRSSSSGHSSNGGVATIIATIHSASASASAEAYSW